MTTNSKHYSAFFQVALSQTPVYGYDANTDSLLLLFTSTHVVWRENETFYTERHVPSIAKFSKGGSSGGGTNRSLFTLLSRKKILEIFPLLNVHTRFFLEKLFCLDFTHSTLHAHFFFKKKFYSSFYFYTSLQSTPGVLLTSTFI